MKSRPHTPAFVTFSLADFPSGERMKLEKEIIERALALWRRKQLSSPHAMPGDTVKSSDTPTIGPDGLKIRPASFHQLVF